MLSNKTEKRHIMNTDLLFFVANEHVNLLEFFLSVFCSISDCKVCHFNVCTRVTAIPRLPIY